MCSNETSRFVFRLIPNFVYVELLVSSHFIFQAVHFMFSLLGFRSIITENVTISKIRNENIFTEQFAFMSYFDEEQNR